MSPEFGATSTLFPIDDETLTYLRLTGRSDERVDLVERYAKAQGLWREPGDGPEFDALLELDLGTVEPSLAGPRRPQDRVALAGLDDNFRAAYPGDGRRPGQADRGRRADRRDRPRVGRDRGDHVVHEHLQPDRHGRGRAARPQRRREGPQPSPGREDVARAGLEGRHRLPRAGRAHGPARRRSASRSPGTAARRASATPGRSTSRSPPAVEADELVVAAVLSGNRNFEGRIHPLVRASYLASPPLVVAFALAGRVDIDLTTEPLGHRGGRHAGHARRHLALPDEVREVIGGAVDAELFRETYAVRVRGRRPVARAADPGGRPLRLGSRHRRTSPTRRSSRA